MEKIAECPVCGNSGLREFLKSKDYFLSGKEFVIEECIQCRFRFTNPRPDVNEIVPYYESADYIAHDAGNGTMIESIYKFVRNIALRNKFKVIRENSNGNNLLDIGCGTGEFLHYCKNKGFHATGIEPNPKARNFAIQNYSLEVNDENHLKELPLSEYNVITLWHVLEHVHDLNGRIQTIKKLLKPDGTLLIAVPNSDSQDAQIFGQFWAAYDLPRHLYHFTPKTMKVLLERNGFTIFQTVPLKFDAYYISLLSEKYQKGKQNYFNTLKNGFKSNFSAMNHNKNYSSLIYLCRIAQEAK